MLMVLLLVALLGCVLGETRYYHTYNGTVVSNETVQQYQAQGVAPFCVIDVEDCDPNEGRRADGTCNNLNAPSRGGRNSPGTRELPAEFCGVDRPQQECKNLRPSREIRTTLMQEGIRADRKMTNLVPTFWVFMATDIGFPSDSGNYFRPGARDCCSPTWRTDNPRCVQVEIPRNDFLHRFTGVTCQNTTVPMSYQNTGCLANGTTPSRINSATPEIDLSVLYGITEAQVNTMRSFENGELLYEVENGKVWPPIETSPIASVVCINNVAPTERRCHRSADLSANSLLGINLGFTWFFRLHNYLTQQLKEQNPSWDDEKLFQTARDINIAIAVQIYYYDLLADTLGYDNLVKDGVLSESPLHRDLYDENEVPQLALEYAYALRWVHTITEGNLRLYDNDGTYLKNIGLVNITGRTGWLAVDNNIDYLTIGMSRQPSGGADTIVDPDLAESAGGLRIQRNLDIITNDHLKSRYFGLPPYIKYLELCFDANITSYDDLEEFVEYEGIENLKLVYPNVEDIELMAGMWVEKHIPGGNVPLTFYCLVTKQMQRNLRMNRFHYERPNRPGAFNEAQLLEIRKWTMAKVLCTVGDGITSVQPSAFLLPGPGNEIGSCDKVTKESDFSVFNYNN